MIKVIKENIKQELKSRNKSIQSFCKGLGVERNYISQLREHTPVSKIIKIAQAIGCTTSDLLKGI